MVDVGNLLKVAENTITAEYTITYYSFNDSVILGPILLIIS